MDTPIAETGFIGAAVGAALSGMRPVAELMFVDFFGVCMDQIYNHMAKIHYESGGNLKVPVVLTTAIGGGYSDGAQHSQTLCGLFAHLPGMKVVVPSRRTPPLDVHVVTSHGLWPGRGHREVALAALEGGADAIQLRCPELDDADLLALARELVPVCAARGVPLVVNNRVEVAVAAEASGVHLGQDADLGAARRRLRTDQLLGVSVATPAQAAAAEHIGADYLGVTVWPTATKPEAEAVGVAGLRAIAAASSLPVVAIGGISAARVAEALDAGAAGVAVVSAVGAAADPVAATRALAAAVRRHRPARTRERA